MRRAFFFELLGWLACLHVIETQKIDFSQLELDDSPVPCFIIDTGGATVPDEPAIMAELHIADQCFAANRAEAESLSDLFRFSLNPGNLTSYHILIEKSGQSSLFYPKVNFHIKVVDAAGNNRKESLLGLPKDDSWVLHGPFVDRSLIRNALAYTLSRSAGVYAPRTAFFELILGSSIGELMALGGRQPGWWLEGAGSSTGSIFRGLYVLEERIKRGSQRVDVKATAANNSKDEIRGYIVRSDKSAAADRSVVLGVSGAKLLINVYPKLPTLAQIDLIHQDLEVAEAVLFGPCFNSSTNSGDSSSFVSFEEVIDSSSAQNYFLIQELTNNVDAFRWSTYLHRVDRKAGLNSPLRFGPPWDFDLAFGNVDYDKASSPIGWRYGVTLSAGEVDPSRNLAYWLHRMLQHPPFVQTAISKWRSLRLSPDGPWSREHIIDAASELLRTVGLGAALRDSVRWPWSGRGRGGFGWAADGGYDAGGGYVSEWVLENEPSFGVTRNCSIADIMLSYVRSVEALSSFLLQRAEWLDSALPQLYEANRAMPIQFFLSVGDDDGWTSSVSPDDIEIGGSPPKACSCRPGFVTQERQFYRFDEERDNVTAANGVLVERFSRLSTDDGRLSYYSLAQQPLGWMPLSSTSGTTANHIKSVRRPDQSSGRILRPNFSVWDLMLLPLPQFRPVLLPLLNVSSVEPTVVELLNSTAAQTIRPGLNVSFACENEVPLLNATVNSVMAAHADANLSCPSTPESGSFPAVRENEHPLRAWYWVWDWGSVPVTRVDLRPGVQVDASRGNIYGAEGARSAADGSVLSKWFAYLYFWDGTGEQFNDDTFWLRFRFPDVSYPLEGVITGVPKAFAGSAGAAVAPSHRAEAYDWRPPHVCAYALTSAGDAPERDPRQWRLEARGLRGEDPTVSGASAGVTNNGSRTDDYLDRAAETTWTVLDTRRDIFFEDRGQTMFFAIHPGAGRPAEWDPFEFYFGPGINESSILDSSRLDNTSLIARLPGPRYMGAPHRYLEYRLVVEGVANRGNANGMQIAEVALFSCDDDRWTPAPSPLGNFTDGGGFSAAAEVQAAASLAQAISKNISEPLPVGRDQGLWLTSRWGARFRALLLPQPVGEEGRNYDSGNYSSGDDTENYSSENGHSFNSSSAQAAYHSAAATGVDPEVFALCLRSRDAARVWLDAELVIDYDFGRPTTPLLVSRSTDSAAYSSREALSTPPGSCGIYNPDGELPWRCSRPLRVLSDASAQNTSSLGDNLRVDGSKSLKSPSLLRRLQLDLLSLSGAPSLEFNWLFFNRSFGHPNSSARSEIGDHLAPCLNHNSTGDLIVPDYSCHFDLALLDRIPLYRLFYPPGSIDSWGSSAGLFHCTDINECSSSTPAARGPCLPGATCSNTPGAFRCDCPPGEIGDGVNTCVSASSIDPEAEGNKVGASNSGLVLLLAIGVPVCFSLLSVVLAFQSSRASSYDRLKISHFSDAAALSAASQPSVVGHLVDSVPQCGHFLPLKTNDDKMLSADQSMMMRPFEAAIRIGSAERKLRHLPFQFSYEIVSGDELNGESLRTGASVLATEGLVPDPVDASA